jgi:hypothetical protein
MAATTVDHPSTGLIANTSSRKTSDTGASIIASSTGENRKSRTVRKSFIGCAVPPDMRLRLASKIAANTRGLILRSKAIAASCMTSARTHSSTSISTKAHSTSKVSMASVVWLRLLTTRS